jgi:hypothetical protein
MTLIPAFACKNGFVIHADSEENCGAFRRSVQKIVPQKMGQLNVIIAGSGIGALIESFTARLKERLDRDNASDIVQVKRLIEQRLANFYSSEVANYPATDEEKLHKFIIAVHSPSNEFVVWAAASTTLIPITAYELAGVEDRLYDHFAQRLYKPDMTFSQAILAGLYLLTVAESTSSFVRAPYQVAVVSAAGIQLETSERVKALTERLAAYQQHVDRLFLQCADVSICLPDFEDLVDEFKRTASALHREHLDQRAATTSMEELLKFDDDPLRPVGSFSFNRNGELTAIHDRETIHNLRNIRNEAERARSEMQSNRKMVDGKDVAHIHCATDGCNTTFLGKLNRDAPVPTLDGKCPRCGEVYHVEHPDVA